MKHPSICSATATTRSAPRTLGASVRWVFAITQSPRARLQNGHVERLIGSIRRECLDHLVVSDEGHLRRVLKTYAAYYNQVRTHLALSKDAPTFRRSYRIGSIVALPILGGLIINMFGFEVLTKDKSSENQKTSPSSDISGEVVVDEIGR
jgi:hypothetical protein